MRARKAPEIPEIPKAQALRIYALTQNEHTTLGELSAATYPHSLVITITAENPLAIAVQAKAKVSKPKPTPRTRPKRVANDRRKDR